MLFISFTILNLSSSFLASAFSESIFSNVFDISPTLFALKNSLLNSSSSEGGKATFKRVEGESSVCTISQRHQHRSNGMGSSHGARIRQVTFDFCMTSPSF